MSGGLPAAALQPHPAAGSQPVQHAQVGLWWPAADPARLRAGAAAWRSLAADVEAVSEPASAVARGVVAENQGHAVDAFEAYWGSRWVGGNGALPAVAEGARALAEALDRYAAAVDKARAQIEELIVAAATVAIVGVALTVVTVGISDVAAGAVAGSLIAAAAAVGIELSTEVAAIIATGLVFSSVGALEGGLSDLAIQGERVGYFHDQASINWNEVLQYSAVGAATAVEAAAPALARIGARLNVGRVPAGAGARKPPSLFSSSGVQTNAEVVASGSGLQRTAATVEDVAARAGIPLENTSVRIVGDNEVDYIRYLDSQGANAVTPSEL
ncbi:MAG: hypothetical protein M3170_01570, partial [Candidatus Dormibacteraeota bacterium]|nr:hypothetical protein [Candidatus Dormibacteraeota bacterium]